MDRLYRRGHGRPRYLGPRLSDRELPRSLRRLPSHPFQSPRAMQIFATTPRLVLRELHPDDTAGMFELDSDPEVHRYLGQKPLQSIEQSRNVIEFVRRQYADNGIGRWAVIEKDSG